MPYSFAALAAMSIPGAGLAFAQTAAKPPEFEVASIKPSDPAATGSALNLGNGEALTATNTTVRTLITFAYNIRDLQLAGGPAWIGNERFDVAAKTDSAEFATHLVDGKLSHAQRIAGDDRVREKTRKVLADRFGLVVHRETRDQAVYLLSVAKNGSKLKEITGPADRHGTNGGRGRSQGSAATMEMLRRILSNDTGRPVLDQTGLTGNYDWLLEWTPDNGQPTGAPDPASSLRCRNSWV